MVNMTYRYAQVANAKRGIMRERIVRVLLTEPDGSLTKYQLAKKAESSFPWTHELLGKLDTLELVEGTRVKNYAGLLKYWLKVKIKPEKKEYMHRDPISLIKKAGMPYALTTYQAENLVQQYLFPSRTDLYIKGEHKEKWHQLIATEGLVGKGNLRLLMADDHVFYGSFHRQGLTIVCIPQLIVDLFEEGGVCTEAAEKLIEKVNQHAIRTE
jgi:hypothetical protein